MLLFKRFVFLMLLPLAACGFTPVYGPQGSAEALRNNTHISDPDTSESYQFTKHLESRLGRNSAGRFALDVKIDTSQEGLNVNAQGYTERFNVLGTADYTLTDHESGAILASGSVNSFTGYSASGSTVATHAARDDAYKRLMVILADLVLNKLISSTDFSK